MALDCILSLTTWKKRINEKAIVVNMERMIHQNTTYNHKVVLVLSDEEFPGKEKDIPQILTLMAKVEPKFEILWTHRNTRALKKLNPVMEAYPDLPIITTDDDIMLTENALQTYMEYHKTHPNVILSECGRSEIFKNIKTSGVFRLYPPHSLFNLSDDIFANSFSMANDDLFNAIRAAIAGTDTVYLHKNICTTIFSGGQANTLFSVYSKINWHAVVHKFLQQHAEYAKFFN